MNRQWILLAAVGLLAGIAGCAEPSESTGDGGEVECDDENNIDVGAPDETTNVGGVECEETEVDADGNA